jgi:DNA-binding NarL/FixJ family response regulator
VTAGLSNGAIAERLHFLVSAVEKNINAIFAKLDLSGPGGPGVHQT